MEANDHAHTFDDGGDKRDPADFPATCPRASWHAPVLTTGPQQLAAANKDNEEAERAESLGKPDGSPDDEGLDVPESSPSSADNPRRPQDLDNDKKVGLTLKSDHKDDTKSPELIAANVTSQSHESIEKEMAESELVELNKNLDANVRVNLKLDRDRRRSIQTAGENAD